MIKRALCLLNVAISQFRLAKRCAKDEGKLAYRSKFKNGIKSQTS